MNKKKDQIETTGHVFDGDIEEYNNPVPKWWIIVFVVTIIWAIAFFCFFPFLPNQDNSDKWTSRKALEKSSEIIKKRGEKYLADFQKSSFKEILDNENLLKYAIKGGDIAFKNNCSACHGTGGAPYLSSFPNLTDDDWLWGGSVEEIYYTIKYGIRSAHDKTRYSLMSSFGRDAILNKEEIDIVADYVLSLSKRQKSPTYKKGKEIFLDNCASCHGVDGKGNKEFGAPNLSDFIWLYGGEKSDIIAMLNIARAGVMPYFEGRISEDNIRKLALYVYQLGGGK